MITTETVPGTIFAALGGSGTHVRFIVAAHDGPVPRGGKYDRPGRRSHQDNSPGQEEPQRSVERSSQS
jgi:hypothetical protein